MAHTMYIRPDVRELHDKNKPEGWTKSDYNLFLAHLHDDMDELERAQRQYDFQLWLKEYRRPGQ